MHKQRASSLPVNIFQRFYGLAAYLNRRDCLKVRNFCRSLLIAIVLFATSSSLSKAAQFNVQIGTPDASGNHYHIIFAARPPGPGPTGYSSTGHTFVVLRVMSQSNAVVEEHGFGFYPQGSGAGTIILNTFANVAGNMVDEIANGSMKYVSDIVDVEVNEVQYAQANNEAQSWGSFHQYALGFNDCVSFEQSMASSIGLTHPPRQPGSMKPVSYIQAMQRQVAQVASQPYAGATYTGTSWSDFTLSGLGTYTAASGSTFSGQIVGGLKHGPATVTGPGGWVAKLNYQYNFPDGPLTVQYANGDAFSSSYSHGSAPVQGTYTYKDRSSYVGGFSLGKANGSGTFTWPSGDTIAGTFSDGVLNGACTYRHNGASYQGNASGGLAHFPTAHVTGDHDGPGLRVEPWTTGKEDGNSDPGEERYGDDFDRPESDGPSVMKSTLL